MSPLGHIVERCAGSCALSFIPPPHGRSVFRPAQAAGRAGGRSALARSIRGSRRRKRQTAKYFLLPSSVTHAKKVCSSIFGIAPAPLTAEKATTLSSDRPLIFRRPRTPAEAPSSPHGEHGRFRPLCRPAASISVTPPIWSRPCCQRQRSTITHSNAFVAVGDV